MVPIPQSTSFVVVFKAFLSSDHLTEATGKTIAITISKAGGAFGNPNAGATNATEISSGWYKVTLDTTDTGTLGIVAIRGTAATIDDYGDRFFVVSATTGGLTNLDAAVSSRLATAGYTAPSNLTAAQIATGVWQDTTAGDFTTALSVGKSVMNGVALGTGLTVNALTTNNDKTGYALSSAGVQAIWDALTSALTTVGSIGKLIVDNLNATITSRMATYVQPTGFLAATFPGTVASPTNITAASGVALTAAYDLAKTAAQAGDAMALTSGERNSTADAFLNRDMSTGTDSGSTTVRTVRQALRFLRNKWSIAGGTLTVTKEDDATSSWTAAITTTAGDPVSASDPAGP